MKKRIISLVMVLALVFTMLPIYAIADNGSAEPDVDTSFGQSIDIQDIIAQIKAIIGGDVSGDLGDILEGLDADQIAAVIKQFIGNNETVKAILDKLGEIKNNEELAKIIEALINGGDINIGDLIPDLGDKDLGTIIAEVIASVGGDAGSIDTGKLIEVINGLISGGDISDIIGGLDKDQISAIIASIIDQIGGSGDIGDIGSIDTDKIIEIIKGLIGDDIDIGDLVNGLDTDKLIEIIKGLIGDNDTIASILEKLDSAKLAEIIKALIDGGIDIGGIVKNLDAYTLLKVIAGLIGSELDVTGPKDVTVDEGENAVFNVKVNTAGTYKYMWLEPNTVKSIDLSGIDLSGSKLELAIKLMQALKKVALSTTDTLTIAKTSADDNGRTFACMIYNIALNDTTLFITDEAKLTVNPAAPHEHTKVVDTPAVAATCMTAGCTEGSHCSECGEILSKSEVIPATGHNYVHKVCANCGDEIPFPFTDVKKTDWCYNDVKYVWQYDIMFGVSDTKFGPRTYMTRAMFVTVLYRLEGSPSVEGMQIPAFTDIGAKWCYDAIIWAYNTHVTYGKTATTFDPNASITRAEIVAMIYRYAGSPSVSGSLGGFVDASSIGAWAKDAVIWATSLGVIHGYTDGRFGPNRTALRSEMAAMLHRYMEMSSVL